jgi:hypothetical protein
MEGKVGLMRKIVIGAFVGLALGLLSPRIATAQGTTTFLSNLGQTPDGNNLVGSDSWLAAGFVTGGNTGGYVLNSVLIELMDPSGVPGNLTVMLYSDRLGGISPATSLAVLGGPVAPSTSGTYTYTPGSSLTLSPGNDYFVVVTASSMVATGSYNWSASGVNNYNPSGGWISLAGGWTSSNGTSWANSSAVFSQFAINATPAPEPGMMGLLAAGGLIVAIRRLSAKFGTRSAE